jgi:hypothetical protein
MDGQYWLANGSSQQRPGTLSEVQSRWRSGAITAGSFYWRAGLAEWVSLSSPSELPGPAQMRNPMIESSTLCPITAMRPP